MEIKRETPSTLISLHHYHPQFYELRKSPLYSGLLIPQSSNFPFWNFKTDSLYQFPLIDAQSSPNDIHALISSSLFTYTKQFDINLMLEELHKNSPFKKTMQFNRIPITESSNLISNIDLLSQSFIVEDSDILGSSSVISYIPTQDIQTIEDKDREAICTLLNDFHRKPENLNQLNSLTPASLCEASGYSFEGSVGRCRVGSFLSSDELAMSLAEEGTVQSIRCDLEHFGYASKNLPFSYHCKPELHKIPQKDLTSMNSPFTSILQEPSLYHPCSPILRKLVFCKLVPDIPDTLEIICSVSTTGFVPALNIEYSNIEIQNKAYADHSKAEKFLLTTSIAHAISNNSAIWISCGFEHCALLTGTGKIMTWGYGASGCLGHGDTNSVSFPTIIQSLHKECFKYVECGGYHNLAISDNCEMYLWGRGDVNQLGIPFKQLYHDEHGYVALNPLKLESIPKKIKGGACGEAHTLVLDEEGSIYTFGWGEDGQLGIIPTESEGIKYNGVTQINFLFPSSIIKVAAGLIFSVCLTENGEVYVWGSGDKGQFGREIDDEFISSPQKMDLEKVVDVVCGESRVICVTENGDVYAWGLGRAGHFSPAIHQFPTGSDLVCNSIKQLGETDIVHHILI